MTVLIIIFGALILLAGVLLLLKPEVIFGFLRNNIENPVIQVIAVLVRLIIGWMSIPKILHEISERPEAFTPWFKIYMTEHKQMINELSIV